MRFSCLPFRLVEFTPRSTFICYVALAGIPSTALGQSLPSSFQPSGQYVHSSDPSRLTYKRIEQGIADTGPLRVGLRDPGVNLMVPTGFQDVFEILPSGSASTSPAYNAAVNTQKQFARVNGAVVAVFPQSIYTSSKDGVIVEIPPGSVFYIGGIPKNLYTPSIGHFGGPDENAGMSATLADTRVDMSVKAAGGRGSRDPAGARRAPLIRTTEQVVTGNHDRQSVALSDHSALGDRTRADNIPVPATFPRGVMTDEEVRQRVVQALLQSAVAPRKTSETRPETPSSVDQDGVKKPADPATPNLPAQTDTTGNK